MSASPGLRKRRCSARGFTLVELMVVVTITGILAAIGITLVRGHMVAAKAKGAAVGAKAIRVAEEAFRAQTGQYLNVSLGATPKYYPMPIPGKRVYDWRQSDQPDWDRWKVLGVPRDGGTQFGYLVNAGRPGQALPTFNTEQDPELGTPTDSWFVIQVRGDLDGDGVFMNGITTSYKPELYLEHEGE